VTRRYSESAQTARLPAREASAFLGFVQVGLPCTMRPSLRRDR